MVRQKLNLKGYIERLNSYLLPEGVNINSFLDSGSLNDHSDSFADRPLPYRVFLDKAFNDDCGDLIVFKMQAYTLNWVWVALEAMTSPLVELKKVKKRTMQALHMVAPLTKMSWRLGAYMLAGDAMTHMKDEHHDGDDDGEEHHDPS